MSRRTQEESVYDWGQLGAGAAAGAPRVKTYNVPAPAAGPKVKMHADSSQVSTGDLYGGYVCCMDGSAGQLHI